MMENATVWEAMARAYESSEGDLAERLLAALEAAQEAGGDIRGRQSAALIVVSGEEEQTYSSFVHDEIDFYHEKWALKGQASLWLLAS